AYHAHLGGAIRNYYDEQSSRTHSPLAGMPDFHRAPLPAESYLPKILHDLVSSRCCWIYNSEFPVVTRQHFSLRSLVLCAARRKPVAVREGRQRSEISYQRDAKWPPVPARGRAAAAARAFDPRFGRCDRNEDW